MRKLLFFTELIMMVNHIHYSCKQNLAKILTAIAKLSIPGYILEEDKQLFLLFLRARDF